MPDTKTGLHKKQLEQQLKNFLSDATIEALREKLYAKYNDANSFLEPDVYKISQELDAIMVQEQKKMFEVYLEGENYGESGYSGNRPGKKF